MNKYFVVCVTKLLHNLGYSQQFKIASIFGDNMVIQQQINAPIWGFASTNEKINIQFAGYTIETITEGSGKWYASLPILTASGPYVMNITCKDQNIKFINEMVGEVWLASGQSNMSMTNDKVSNSETYILLITIIMREFHVDVNESGTPKEVLDKSGWNVCTPENAKSYSAVAYFFARALHQDRKVAVGIINASKGGTTAEAWMSADALFTHPDFKSRMLELRLHPEDWAKMDMAGLTKHRQYRQIIETTTAGLQQNVNQENYDDSKWQHSNYPLIAADLKIEGYKLIWFRKEFQMPASFISSDFNLSLGKTIHEDVVYINGIKVGSNDKEGNHLYTVPYKVLKPGKNIIAILLLSEWGYGRIGNLGDEPSLNIVNGKLSISLKGEWSYNAEIEPTLPVAKHYWNEPTSLFNGMIAPIIPYGIRGALWYHEEGNSGNAQQYESLLPLLINDWSVRWRLGYFSFLFVQLPNYIPGGNNWVKMREIQSKALQYPNTGLIVTLDIGDPEDVHPLNKEPVGERLYKEAKRVAYHENSASSGPVYQSMYTTGNVIYLKFFTSGGALVYKVNARSTGFLIAGSDEVFYDATDIHIVGDEVCVSIAKVPKPIAVRYAWNSNPVVTIYNEQGLLASPFRTDRFEY